MFKMKYHIVFVFLIGVLTGCAGSLKIVPTVPTTPSPNMVVENPKKDIEDQFRLNEPKYSISLPQKMVLHKSLYWPEKSRLYLWLMENSEYELIAIDLTNSKILWTNKLPKRTKVYRVGKTVADDVYLDLNYYGSTLAFLDPNQGMEKLRYGKDARLYGAF